MSSFYELKTQSTIYDSIVSYISDHEDLWKPYDSWDILFIPKDLIIGDPVINSIHKKFPLAINQTRPVCLKSNPNTFYKLHRDINRTAAINMLITGWNSHTFFGEEITEEMSSVDRLVYKKYHYYILDVKKLHAVLNYDEPRIVFSLGFHLPATFNSVLEFLTAKNL